jgi:hypothetical protein
MKREAVQSLSFPSSSSPSLVPTISSVILFFFISLLYFSYLSEKRENVLKDTQYVFMAWCLVKHRDNFTFLLITNVTV